VTLFQLHRADLDALIDGGHAAAQSWAGAAMPGRFKPRAIAREGPRRDRGCESGRTCKRRDRCDYRVLLVPPRP